MQLKTIWYFLCRHLFVFLSNKQFHLFTRWIHSKRLGFPYYKLSIDKPQTFNEHLFNIKLFERPSIGQRVADKISVRDYIEEKIGPDYLIPIIEVYDSVDHVSFDHLPSQFALKTNHGSGWNLIVKDKNQINWKKSKRKLKSWLKKNAYYLSREWQYKDIHPKLICEHLLAYEIKDYKIYCFKGEPKAIQVDTDRFSGHRRNIYDADWNLLDFQFIYKNTDKSIKKPSKLDEMLKIASKIASELRFCRVDLYEHEGKIYFGEITLHPEGGNGFFKTYHQDLAFANFLGLNDPR